MKNMEIYRCNRCGLQMMVTASGLDSVKAPLCCGIPMCEQKANTVDAAKEKHVPVIESDGSGTVVKVGSITHPSTAEHFIEWIELIADGVSYKKFLKPGDEPVAEFNIKADHVVAREYCNLHGLWKAEL